MNRSGVIRTKRDITRQVFDVATSCRICVTKNVNMRDLFIKSNKTLIENIKFCTGVALQNEDGLPTRICKSCIDQLSISYKFKTLCISSEQFFENYLADKIKPDLHENNDNDDKIIYDDDEGDSKITFQEEIIYDDECDVKEADFKYDDNFTDNYDMKEEFIDIKEADHISDYSVNAEDEAGLIESREVQRCSNQRKSKKSKKKDEKSNCKPIKRRGPYKKGAPPRMKKLKFSRLTCIPCGLKFLSKQEFDEHKKQFLHEPDSFICEVCGKTFTHRASHHSHLKSHMPPTFACEHCDYRTANKFDLEKHIRIHLGIKKYHCALCPKAYHTSSNLREHERRLHEGQRNFACPQCERMFYDRTKLNRHLDSHNDIKRFECDFCHSAFTRRCYWKKHLERQHSVILPPQRPGRQKNSSLITFPPTSTATTTTTAKLTINIMP